MPTARTVADLVQNVAFDDGNRTAIIFQDTSFSYAELDSLIESTANALAARGVRKGDRVCVMLPNIPHFMLAYYAVLRLRAVVVPINVLYKSEEIEHIVRNSGAQVVIAHEAFLAQVLSAPTVSLMADKVIVVAAEEPAPPLTWWPVNPPILDAGAKPRAPLNVEPDDLAVICYTSGTTGRSKGAMLTHRNLIANCDQMAEIERLEVRTDDKVLLVLPLFHIYAMNAGMNRTFHAGAGIVLLTRFEPVSVLEAMQRHHSTIFLGAPPMFVAWVNMPNLRDFDLSSLRMVSSGAAALPASVLEQFSTVTGVQIAEGYGLTESSPVSHSNFAGPAIKPGTVGPTIPGVEARIVDEFDQDVAPGAEGEILLRGANITAGYWQDPASTAEALRGGWFHTGDIGSADHDGYYTIVDRLKDMINAGGFKVWPREVEEVLYSHHAVRDAAVVAIPDAYTGERPMAFVALRAGQASSEEELITYCKERLAIFKAPCRIAFREDLPKLLTGKILRRQLRDEARELGGSHGTT